MRKNFLGLLFIVGAVFILSNCSDDDPVIEDNPVSTDLSLMPFDKLSSYNLFVGDMADLNTNEGVIPYELVTPLFTDYALKERFLFVPEGASSDFVANNEVIDFPVGSILVKNFIYHQVLPNKDRKILETRLLVRKQDDWKAYVYEWNDEQTEATFLQIGRRIPISWEQKGNVLETDYLIPTQEECKTCHRYDSRVAPIGPKPQNLDLSLNYGPDGSHNQLARWQDLGYLKAITEEVEAIADWEDSSLDLEDRARAYLDVNCAHCHNTLGSASNTSLYYDIEVADEDLLGFCKAPISAGGDATGGLSYDIVPGKADQSILIYRLQSTEAEVAMPELGRTMNHTEGIKLISDWINSLPEDDRCN